MQLGHDALDVFAGGVAGQAEVFFVAEQVGKAGRAVVVVENLDMVRANQGRVDDTASVTQSKDFPAERKDVIGEARGL